MTNGEFTERTFPNAVRWLLETNGYAVEGPITVNGAEVDLVATQVHGLGSQRVFVEVTVQYVDNTKYGKDLTKLDMFRNEPGAQRIIVSSVGFTPQVRERATASGIGTYTYDELFRSFEKTDRYIDSVLGNGELALSLAQLDQIYVEPLFRDASGRDDATKYLTSWLKEANPEHRWVVVVGEYGTGKTALTQVLQRRWTTMYKNGLGTPLPFRIELRDFNRQFDARSLLHHFLDRSGLAHLPVEFVESMIANGRVVLLLDGYDEMAQYLNIRERRACLEALADLASAGAKGILTSRPNYFTEAEELRVFEVLYQKLTAERRLSTIDRLAIEEEKRIDDLFERFLLERRERRLEDLTSEQTEELVSNQLQDDPDGAALVVGLLRRVSRQGAGESVISLAGKPVIATYLLDVVTELKRESSLESGQSTSLSEWQIFDLIVDNLMLRDFKRTPELIPSERREFLRFLAFELATKQAKAVDESSFRGLVGRYFAPQIARRTHDGQTDYADALFENLRSSATLTRAESRKGYVWQFSHNSLAEFMLTEQLLAEFLNRKYWTNRVPITDSMRLFAGTQQPDDLKAIGERLALAWPERKVASSIGQFLSLVWDGLVGLALGDVRATLQGIAGDSLDISHTTLEGIAFAQEPAAEADLVRLIAQSCEFIEIDFSRAKLTGADFRGSVFDGCTFANAIAGEAVFLDCIMFDCDITDLTCAGADWRGLDSDSTAMIHRTDAIRLLNGEELRGYLGFLGGRTDPVDAYYLYSHLADFGICEKICRHLIENTWGQLRGLVQRGVSKRNVRLAKSFVEHLLTSGYAQEKGGVRGLIGATPSGRGAFARLVERHELDSELEAFMRKQFRPSS